MSTNEKCNWPTTFAEIAKKLLGKLNCYSNWFVFLTHSLVAICLTCFGLFIFVKKRVDAQLLAMDSLGLMGDGSKLHENTFSSSEVCLVPGPSLRGALLGSQRQIIGVGPRLLQKIQKLLSVLGCSKPRVSTEVRERVFCVVY